MQREAAITIALTSEVARKLWPVPFSCRSNDSNQTGHFRNAFHWLQDGRVHAPLRATTECIPPKMSLSPDAIWDMPRVAARLPADRHADAVRFVLGEECDGVLHVRFASELRLSTRVPWRAALRQMASATWLIRHEDSRIQRMAECYVQVQLERRSQPKA